VLQKIKEGVFISPQIRQLFRDEQFNCILSGNKNTELDGFRLVAANFLGNNRANNYKELWKTCCCRVRNWAAVCL
jgi:hypothetical protein